VVRLRGTAFAIAPGGYLVAAAHVADPSGAELAAGAHRLALELMDRPHTDEIVSRWVARTGARPAGGAVLSRRLTAAAPDGARGLAHRGGLVLADRDSDLALLRIAAPRASAVLLSDSTTAGTPVAALGFGGGGGDGRPAPREPAIRRGRLAQTGFFPRPHLATVITAAVRSGDSGAPVVDAEGRAHGVVVALHRQGGIMEDASELRALLRRAGIANGRGRSGALFAGALARLWALDLAGASRGLEATLREYPGHALAARELRRVRELASAHLALEGADRRDGALRALAAASAAAAAACATLLLRRGRRGEGRRVG
jgi:trypsin-like peptidase